MIFTVILCVLGVWALIGIAVVLWFKGKFGARFHELAGPLLLIATILAFGFASL